MNFLRRGLSSDRQTDRQTERHDPTCIPRPFASGQKTHATCPVAKTMLAKYNASDTVVVVV